jgi:chorismate mutase
VSERLRAIRGALTVAEDTPAEVVSATRLLLEDMVARNSLAPDDMVSLIFTATADVTSQFPAVAAREMGLTGVPLLCATEIPVPDSLPLCVRVMLHAYMPLDRAVVHSYLREAVRLRDDLVNPSEAS